MALAFFWIGLAQASIVLTFANGDSLEGDIAGDSSDPWIDPDTSISATLTTRAISPDGVLNPNNNSLGINAVGNGDTNDEFDLGESWAFDWNVDTLFEGIDFDGLNQSEIFTISSLDFVGLTLGTLSSDVSYNSADGAFTFSDSGNDIFELADLGLTNGILVSAGNDITIAFGDSGSGSGRADIAGITFGTTSVIPEPSSLLILSVMTAMTVLFRRPRRVNV